jgi:altronate dehydratase
METKYLKINSADNVAVAITALPAGEKLIVDGKEIILNEDIPAGHKFALKDFAEGENVIKYGYPIGHARTARKQGLDERKQHQDQSCRTAGIYVQPHRSETGHSAQGPDI